MKALVIGLVLSSLISLTGCVAYPTYGTVAYSGGYVTGGTEIYYDSRPYYYDPYFVGSTYRLYYYDGGHRNYRYVPRNHFYGRPPVARGHYYSHHR